VLDNLIARDESGGFTLDAEIAARLETLVSEFARSTHSRQADARIGADDGGRHRRAGECGRRMTTVAARGEQRRASSFTRE
jgi:hypothetical protein